jgi:hypothetical protein
MNFVVRTRLKTIFYRRMLLDILISIAGFFGSILLSLILSFSFIELFVWVQTSSFRTLDTLMFIQGEGYATIALIVFFIIGFCVNLWIRKKLDETDVGIIPIVTVLVLILGMLLELYPFFHYSRVAPDGIFVRHSIGSEIHYTWKQISGVDLSCQFQSGRSRDAAFLNYVITFDDGRSINLYNSKEFGKTILSVDELLEKNNILVVRHPIPAINYLKKKINNEDYFNMVLKLFHEKQDNSKTT